MKPTICADCRFIELAPGRLADSGSLCNNKAARMTWVSGTLSAIKPQCVDVNT